MKMRIMLGILEIEGQANGRDFPRYQRAFRDLNRTQLDGVSVLHVHHCQHEACNPCKVPHFGHSALCGEPCCREAAPWGVLRYFGLELLVTGEVDMMKVPQAYRINENSQFVPCGVCQPFEESGAFAALERIERQNPALVTV